MSKNHRVRTHNEITSRIEHILKMYYRIRDNGYYVAQDGYYETLAALFWTLGVGEDYSKVRAKSLLTNCIDWSDCQDKLSDIFDY